MSLEDFHLLNIEPFDKSIIKTDYSKVYHQYGASIGVFLKTSSFIKIFLLIIDSQTKDLA